jgi:hypothetical protein
MIKGLPFGWLAGLTIRPGANSDSVAAILFVSPGGASAQLSDEYRSKAMMHLAMRAVQIRCQSGCAAMLMILITRCHKGPSSSMSTQSQASEF